MDDGGIAAIFWVDVRQSLLVCVRFLINTEVATAEALTPSIPRVYSTNIHLRGL